MNRMRVTEESDLRVGIFPAMLDDAWNVAVAKPSGWAHPRISWPGFSMQLDENVEMYHPLAVPAMDTSDRGDIILACD